MSRQYSSSDVCSEDRLPHIHVTPCSGHTSHCRPEATSPQSCTVTSSMCLTHSMCLQPRQSSAQVSQGCTERWMRGPYAKGGSSQQQSEKQNAVLKGGLLFPFRLWFACFQTVIDTSKWHSLNDRFPLDDYRK